MLLKPVECNCAIFYGMFVSIEELLKAKKIKHFGGTNIEFVKRYGLDILSMGDEKRAQEYVIGKQLDYFHNFIGIKLMYDNDGKFYFEHMNGDKPQFKLTANEETDIKTKLFKLGVMNFCDYYLFHNYKANVV